MQDGQQKICLMSEKLMVVKQNRTYDELSNSGFSAAEPLLKYYILQSLQRLALTDRPKIKRNCQHTIA